MMKRNFIKNELIKRYLSSSAAGKKYIKEITRLLKLRIHDSSLKTIALKTIHVIAALLLLKPSKSSNSKDHLVSLERRLTVYFTMLQNGQTYFKNLAMFTPQDF